MALQGEPKLPEKHIVKHSHTSSSIGWILCIIILWYCTQIRNPDCLPWVVGLQTWIIWYYWECHSYRNSAVPWWDFISISAKVVSIIQKHGYEFMPFQCYDAANKHAAVWKKWCRWHSWGNRQYLSIFAQQNVCLSHRQEPSDCNVLPICSFLCTLKAPQSREKTRNVGKRLGRSPASQLNYPPPLFHLIGLGKLFQVKKSRGHLL